MDPRYNCQPSFIEKYKTWVSKDALTTRDCKLIQNETIGELSGSMWCDTVYAMWSSHLEVKDNDVKYKAVTIGAGEGSIYNPDFCDTKPPVDEILSQNPFLTSKLVKYSKYTKQSRFDYRDVWKVKNGDVDGIGWVDPRKLKI